MAERLKARVDAALQKKLAEIQAQGGVAINPVDANPVIRKAAETNTKWDYSQECAKLYRRADEIMARFYHGIVVPAFPGKLPAPLIAVAPLNIRTLAAYRIVPDEYGLPFKLTFNEAHFDENESKPVWKWGEWSQMETLVHELAHHWQQLRGKDPFKPGKITHNKEFCKRLEQLDIHPTPGVGSHYAVADTDSPFGVLMREWGIERPNDVPREEIGPRDNWWSFGIEPTRGRSSLALWACAMCGLKVRVGIKDDPRLIHESDGGTFVRG
jgi:hypothetical protein